MSIRNYIGNAIGAAGRAVDLPFDTGLSELVAGGKTAGSGTEPYLFGNGGYQTAPSQPSDSGNVLGASTNQSLADTLAALAAAQGGSGSGGGTAPQYTTLNGVVYDLSTSAGKQRYITDKNNFLDQSYNQQLADYQKQLQNALSNASDTYGQSAADIKESLANLLSDRNIYNNQYQSQVDEFGNQYQTGNVNRDSFFNRLSPNAYQSSQGTSNAFAKKQYDKGLGQLSDTNTQNLNKFAQQEAGLNRDQGNLANQYNAYIQQQQDAGNAFKQNLYNKTQEAKNSDATSLANSDAARGINGFNYQTQKYNPFAAQTVDLSSLTPFINFSQLQGSPQANAFNGVLPTVTTKPQSPQDKYLGYSPTPTKSTDPLTSYLYGTQAPAGV